MPHVGPEVEGHQAKIGRSRPKTAIFWPFLAFGRHLGGLKDPLEVGVEDKTCRTIHGTHLEGILSQKKWTGLAGGVKNVCATLDSTVSVWATLNNNVAYLCYYTMYNIGLEGLLFTLRV